MIWRLALAYSVAILSSGCSTTERCREINIQRIVADADALEERSLYEAIAEDPHLDITDGQAVQQFARRWRASRAAAYRLQMRQEHPTDTFLWRPPANAELDSAGDREPPPRPSELAWYGEHCFEGRAR